MGLIRVVEVTRLDILRVLLVLVLRLLLSLMRSSVGIVHTISHVDSSGTQKACGFVQSCLMVLGRLGRSYLSSVELLTDLVTGIVDEHPTALWIAVSSTALSSHLDVLLVIVGVCHLLLSSTNDLWLVNSLSIVLIILTLP
jgi:hypothetical protein